MIDRNTAEARKLLAGIIATAERIEYCFAAADGSDLLALDAARAVVELSERHGQLVALTNRLEAVQQEPSSK